MDSRMADAIVALQESQKQQSRALWLLEELANEPDAAKAARILLALDYPERRNTESGTAGLPCSADGVWDENDEAGAEWYSAWLAARKAQSEALGNGAHMPSICDGVATHECAISEEAAERIEACGE